MQSTMMNVPLSLNHLLERAGQLFAGNEIVSRRPDKSLVRYRYGDFYRRARALADQPEAFGRARHRQGADHRSAPSLGGAEGGAAAR